MLNRHQVWDKFTICKARDPWVSDQFRATRPTRWASLVYSWGLLSRLHGACRPTCSHRNYRDWYSSLQGKEMQNSAPWVRHFPEDLIHLTEFFALHTEFFVLHTEFALHTELFVLHTEFALHAEFAYSEDSSSFISSGTYQGSKMIKFKPGTLERIVKSKYAFNSQGANAYLHRNNEISLFLAFLFMISLFTIYDNLWKMIFCNAWIL